MVTKNSQIALYKKIDRQLLEKTRINLDPSLTYNNGIETSVIEIDEDIIAINEKDEQWAPDDHELTVNLGISIEEPYRLYGRNSVTSQQNELGIACHIYSKESHFQKTVPVGIINNTRDGKYINFSYVFPKSSLRGNVYLEFYIYLAEIREEIPFQANKVGMILTEENLYDLELIIDGDGSVFPMTEFEEKDGPLWKLEKHWVDANDAIFDASNVNLSLNTSHPLFEQVKKGKTRISRAMMGDIMIQAMSQIIQQVIIVENNDIEADDTYPNSVLAAVKYWIETFEITDTSSIFSISNTLRKHWERKLMSGVSEDD
ncbi:hypothetical protein SAMN04488102_102160 [Alkalibacterium subtropicum]|uniref:Uncharacterized protein n=1 Tax=Alkalibacterium subtropicum TaxID=753702 RepID=A0A1I1FLE8_9LACT|nr:hypothetical protein [Alkalibacterium subtropicum]SFC00237.1 hypothetical protein SAMN04488102_102160 [Alkalibacterium subtropicum]